MPFFRSEIQCTQRQHTTQHTDHRPLRSAVRRHTSRSIIVAGGRLIRQSRVLVAAAQTIDGSAPVAVLQAVPEIAKRISDAHIAPHSACVLDEGCAVSECGAAGLHAGMPSSDQFPEV
jgi:hypothetical protein